MKIPHRSRLVGIIAASSLLGVNSLSAQVVFDINGQQATAGPTAPGAVGLSAISSGSQANGSSILNYAGNTTNYNTITFNLTSFAAGVTLKLEGFSHQVNAEGVNPTTGAFDPNFRRTISARERGALTVAQGADNITNEDLYRDLLFSNHLRYTFSGLTPDTSYDLRFFVWDTATSPRALNNFYNYTQGDTLTAFGGIDQGNGSPTLPLNDDNESSVAGTFTTNSSGELIFRQSSFLWNGTSFNTAFADNARLNGFSIATTPIPEPSTFALLTSIAAFFSVARRRSRCAS
jgi:hypothetical protein